jgi:dethiobiotin synthetase
LSGFFVTGTDTEIGKTVASRALVEYIVGRGLRCAVMKPVASGAERELGGMRNSDAVELMSAANVDVPYEMVNPFVFQEPTAPHLAARDADVLIESAVIRQAFESLRGQSDAVVVEGVGGWLVPLSPSGNVASLARELGLPVILVVGLRLGCINHALLTADAIVASGCVFAGWIANHLSSEFPRSEQNIATLKVSLGAPLLGTVRYAGPEPDDARLEAEDPRAIMSFLRQ